MTEWAPTWRVEVDWAGDGTWTDISTLTVDDEELGRVRSVEWQRGKNSDFGRYEAGTATVVLDNRDRNLEPDYIDSEYWPNVRPMRPIRISSTWDGGDVSVITGYVEGWPPAWDPSGSEASVSVTVTDAFLVFAGARLPASVYAIEVAADEPAAWFRLGETEGTFAGDSSGHGHHGTYEGGATFNTRTGLIWGDPDAAIGFDGDNDYISFPHDIGLTTDDVTLEAWVTWTENGAAQRIVEIADDTRRAFLSINPTGKPFASNGSDSVEGDADLVDGQTAHLVVVFTSTSADLYVDGVESGSGTVVQYPSAGSGGRIGGGLNGGQVAASVIDEVAVYSTALSAGRIAAHYQAGTAPWEGDLSGERVEKLLALIGVGGDQIDIDPGRSVLQRTELSGLLLEPLRAIEESEGGALFATRDGVIRFRDRDAVYDDQRSNTVQVVFGDDWEDGDEIPYTVVEPVYDVASIINSVEARRAGGAAYVVEDATSIVDDGYGYRSASLSLQVLDDRDVIDAAGVLVAERAQPKLRFRKVSVSPSIDPDNLWPVVLELDVGDRVAFRKRPPGGGDPVDVEAIIVGVAGRAPAGHCTIDFTLEPPPLDPFAWADDTDGSRPGLGWADDDGAGGGAWTR